MTTGIEITFAPETPEGERDPSRRRVEYRPRVTGGYWRVEREEVGERGSDTWHRVGMEPVEHAEVEKIERPAMGENERERASEHGST